MPEKRELSRQAYVSLIGLMTLAAEHTRALDAIERAMLELTGETDNKVGSHCGDVIYANANPGAQRGVDDLLERLGLTVVG